MSVRIIKVIIRKGNAGILYLTIAPITGVISPVSVKIINTKKAENIRTFLFSIFLLKKKMQIRPKKSTIRFSNEARAINTDFTSKKKGLKSVLAKATGELTIKLHRFGSRYSDLITLPDLTN